MPQHQPRPLSPVPAVDDDLAWLAVEVVQQEWPGAEDLTVLPGQSRVGTEVDAGVVRVLRAPDLEDDHVAAPRLVDRAEPGRLEVLLIQARPIDLLPPAVLAREALELQAPLALVPVGADLPAVPGAMNERPSQQRDVALRRDGPQVALRPTEDVPGQARRLAHGEVVR